MGCQKNYYFSFILLTGPFGLASLQTTFLAEKNFHWQRSGFFAFSLSNSWSLFSTVRDDVAGQSGGHGRHKNFNGLCLHFVTHSVDLLDVGEDHLGIDSVVADHCVHVVGRQEVGDSGVASEKNLMHLFRSQ